MKVAIVADVHAHNWPDFSTVLPDGCNSRLEHILRALHWAIKKAKAEKVDALIIAGDLHHARRKVDITVSHRVAMFMQAAAEKFPVYLLTGNHDLSDTGDGTHSLKPYTGMAEIVDCPVAYEIGGRNIGFLPYMEDPAEIQRLCEQDLHGCDFIVAHLGLIGGKMGPSDFEVPGKVPLAALCGQRVFLGHYHKYQDVDRNTTYVGALLQHSMGEREDCPGFVIVTSNEGDVSYRHVENIESPRFYSFVGPEIPQCVRMTDYVQMAVPIEQREELEEEIERKELPAVRITIERPVQEASERLGLSKMSVREIVQAWMEHKGVDPDVREEYEQVGMELLLRAGVS